MKLNSILYFILISYINSSEMIEYNVGPDTGELIPLSAFIDSNNNLYYVFFFETIFSFDYINNYYDERLTSTLSLQESESLRSFEIGKNPSIIILTSLRMVSMIQGDNGGYNPEEYEIDGIFDVFSIGNIEDEWRFVKLDRKIYFQNIVDVRLRNNNYIASFDPYYYYLDNIKCKYYNAKVYCICIDSINNKFKFYIIPIDQITDSNQISMYDMDYYSESAIQGTFINIFTFPNSEPLISYSSHSQKFLSNFREEKLEITNSDILFEKNTFIIGEINRKQYYSCAIKSDEKNMIICNIIPYSQNRFTENSVDLEEDIYDTFKENKYLMVNENSYGMIINIIDSSNMWNVCKILDPIITSTTIKIYEEDFSDGVLVKTIDCFSLQITHTGNYYLYINDIKGTIYLNNTLLDKNQYYQIKGNDLLVVYKEENVGFYLKFTLNFGKGVINYETFTYEYSTTETIDEISNTDKIDDIISNIKADFLNDNTNKEYSKYEIYYYSGSTFVEKISKNNDLSTGEFNNSFISSIKTINNINENSNIQIIKLDVKVGDYPTPSVFLLTIDENGNIVNMPSVDIVIEKPIANYNYLNIDRAYKLNEKSINIYNSSDPFFNDICFIFASENNGKDVTLKDRRNEYYVNITFCESNCEFSYFDYVNVKVVCNCHPLSQISGFEELSFSNLKNSFITHLIAFNYKIIKCYKSVFNTGNYDNMGTILIFISIVVCIICTILYIKYHNIEPVKIALEKFQPKTKFNEERIDSIEKMKKTDDIEEINNNNENKNVNNNLFLNNNPVIVDKENNQMNEKGNKDKSVNSINTYSKETLKKDLSSQEIENKRKKIEELKYDLGQLSFEEALIFDNRTIKQKYWDYLLQSQLILSHFYADLILELRYIKIILLMINFSLQFFFNCFFYTDEYISDVYHRNAVISFFSDLPKVIYSILVSFIINTLLKALSYYKDCLIKITFEENDFDIYWKKSNKILNSFYYRLNLFIIIVFILQLFFLYYCTAFCAIYPNNQKVLLFSIFQDFLINALLPFVLCFIIAYFKHLSIQKKNKKLFIVVGFLDYLL